jgi:1-acyl-sn-glycerol-3-phosphate acyltransferase
VNRDDLRVGRARYARTIVRVTGAHGGRALKRTWCARLDVSWARCPPVRMLREGILSMVLGPLIDFYARRRTVGRARFETVRPPVVFVANHSSHLDTPIILRALPRAWRQRTVVAAAADYFYRNRLVAVLVSVAFNTVPIARRGGGLGTDAMDHVSRLITQRWNLLMYPEGTRSRRGEVGRLHSGAAVLAAEHGLSIVPIYVTGTHEAMPPGRSWPRRLRGRVFSRRHEVEVRFGKPIRPHPGEHRSAVMERIRHFYERQTRYSLPAGEDSGNGSGADRASDAPALEGPPLPPVS